MSRFRVEGRGRVRPDRPVAFTFDGRRYEGLEGDTVASALLANGVHLMGRSFKYHRPRGVVAAGSEEPNALIGTSCGFGRGAGRGFGRGGGRAEPNTRATVQEVREGLEATSQNRWPSLRLDAGAVNDRLGRLLAAGFYYKTFMWPRGFWDRVYEPAIRRAAGLGRAPEEPDPDRYASRFAHVEVLVVGAGPAGLMAAREAARGGGRVLLVDEGSEMGGSLLAEPGARIEGRPAWDWLAATLADLRARGVRLLARTTAIAYQHRNMVALCERLTDHRAEPPEGLPRERLWRVRAREVVLAQGAIERPLVFDGNDRPGVMLSGAARTYLNRYGVRVGERAVVLAAHDGAWRAAFDLADAGTAIAAIADRRAEIDPALLAGAQARGVPVLLSHGATGTRGRLRVRAVRVSPIEDGRAGLGRWLRCDCLLMSGGWTPNVSLFSHARGTLRWDEARDAFLPDASAEACRVGGAGAGLWGLEAALEDGARAGAAAAGRKAPPAGSLAVEGDPDAGGGARAGRAHAAPPTDREPASAKAFVDFQNDVTAKDIRLAVREGFRSIEHVKRYTTAGMATDQGKLSNANALAIAADALGRAPPEVGLTTFRPPYTPTTFGAFAGHRRGPLFEPLRKTPIDAWAEARGAVFEPVGQWRRARFFPRPGEGMGAAVARECRAVRASLGLFDASTLGKIEVAGPDAAAFLERMYTNPWANLAPGRCRYGLLLGDDGFIRDDGVIGRLEDGLFHVTTTTGGAARTLSTMEDYLQTEWPDLRVWLTSTTEQWATVALQGPDARRALAPLVEGLDLSPRAFPHMSVARCRVAGLAARLFRVSFTGELGFEVNVPARHGPSLWEALVAAGAPFGVTPYGTEAMHVLRAEKGHIVVGQDTDGTVTPDDAGLGWAVGRAKRDFVGMRALRRPDMLAPGRRQLVGLLTEDGGPPLEEGAQVVLDPDEPVPMRMIGHVTSSYHSEALGRPIALALVEGGRGRIGRTVHLPMPGGARRATVARPAFHDPEGERVNA